MATALQVSVQGVRDVLHDDVGGITLHLEVMDPGDVGVVQTSGQPGLPLEGFQIGGVIGDGLVDDLYGHYPVKDGIPVPVDRPLAASRYPLEEFVFAYTLELGCFDCAMTILVGRHMNVS